MDDEATRRIELSEFGDPPKPEAVVILERLAENPAHRDQASRLLAAWDTIEAYEVAALQAALDAPTHGDL